MPRVSDATDPIGSFQTRPVRLAGRPSCGLIDASPRHAHEEHSSSRSRRIRSDYRSCRRAGHRGSDHLWSGYQQPSQQNGWLGVARDAAAGQALVELGLVLPVLLIMLLGMIDLGRGFVFGVSVQQGAREAARVGATAALDPSVTDSVLVQRLIAASAPALTGCSPVLATTQACGGGSWMFSLTVTAPGGAPSYASLAAARASAPQGFGGYKLEVTARGSVSLLAGFQTGLDGIGLGQINVQGDAAMIVF